MQVPTTSGLRWFQIAALMIMAGHIADNAIEARHISDNAINAVEMIADSVISYDKLDGNLKAKIDAELPYTVSNRVPSTDDDEANTSGVTWDVGTAASRRAKWLYKPDGAPSSDWEVYECVDSTVGAAVWTLTTLSSEDLSDLAFKTQAQLEQDITISPSNFADFSGSVNAVVDLSNFVDKSTNQAINGRKTFGSFTQFNDGVNMSQGATINGLTQVSEIRMVKFKMMNDPSGFIEGLARTGTDILNSTSESDIATPKAVNEALNSTKTSTLQAIQSTTLTATEGTQIAAPEGSVVFSVAFRNGVRFTPSFDGVTYTFDTLEIGEKVTIDHVYYNA